MGGEGTPPSSTRYNHVSHRGFLSTLVAKEQILESGLICTSVAFRNPWTWRCLCVLTTGWEQEVSTVEGTSEHVEQTKKDLASFQGGGYLVSHVIPGE